PDPGSLRARVQTGRRTGQVEGRRMVKTIRQTPRDVEQHFRKPAADPADADQAGRAGADIARIGPAQFGPRDGRGETGNCSRAAVGCTYRKSSYSDDSQTRKTLRQPPHLSAQASGPILVARRIGRLERADPIVWGSRTPNEELSPSRIQF